MANDMHTKSKVVPVMFGQDLILAARVGEEVYVAIKPICDSLGLSWGSQRNRIQRDQILSEGVSMMNMPLAHHGQETVCLRLDLVNGWLFGIDENRVRPDVRETVLRYKRECYRVLFSHFYGAAEGRVKVGSRRQPDPAVARNRSTAMAINAVSNALGEIRRTRGPRVASKAAGELYRKIGIELGDEQPDPKELWTDILAEGARPL